MGLRAEQRGQRARKHSAVWVGCWMRRSEVRAEVMSAAVKEAEAEVVRGESGGVGAETAAVSSEVVVGLLIGIEGSKVAIPEPAELGVIAVSASVLGSDIMEI